MSRIKDNPNRTRNNNINIVSWYRVPIRGFLFDSGAVSRSFSFYPPTLYSYTNGTTKL